MTVVRITRKIGKALLLLTSASLSAGCVAISVTSGIAGAGIAVASTAVGVGVAVGSTAVTATTTVVKAAIPGD